MLRLVTFVPCMLISLYAALEAGRWFGLRRKRMGETEIGGFSAIDGAIYGLMGLLVAFTFSGAASRFDARRELITQETNAMGTAYLRLDLLAASDRQQLRAKMKSYADTRLAFYRDLARQPDMARQDLVRSTALQSDIWAWAVSASAAGLDAGSRSLLLSSLNDMIDITTTRAVALETHPPLIIYFLLVALVCVSSLLAGYEMAAKSTRSWLHVVVYVVVMTSVLYVIVDLEYPRFGLIRIDAADKVMMDLRDTMK